MGIIVLRLRRQDNAHVLGILKRLVATLANEDPAGKLWVVDESRIRIRE